MRRRRRKFTWLPTIGTALPGEGVNASTVQVFEIGVPPVPNGFFLGTSNNIIFPIVQDTPQEGQNVDGTTDEGIGEIIGNEYVVERIVGKVFLGYVAPTSDSGNRSIIVKAGIFVARADDSNPSLPVGVTAGNYGPLDLGTVREPWMWQRTWLLASSFDAENGFTQGNEQNHTNFAGEAGASSYEGPHIDVKSVRRIRQDERLWFTCGAEGVNPRADATGINQGTLDGVLDIRVLGALRRPRNRSSF